LQQTIEKNVFVVHAVEGVTYKKFIVFWWISPIFGYSFELVPVW